MSNEGRSRTRAKGEGNLSRVAGHTVGWLNPLQRVSAWKYTRFTAGVHLQSRIALTGELRHTSKTGEYPLLAGLDLPPQSIMAELVSAIVGLIAVGAKVSDSIYTLIDTLKDAPNEFLALSNEVTDFQLVLSKVIEVRESGEVSAEDGRTDGGFDTYSDQTRKESTSRCRESGARGDQAATR